MIKILGVFCIFTGCLGLIFCWESGVKKRQALCGEWISLLLNWEYALTSKNTRLYDFLSQIRRREGSLNGFLSELENKLKKNIYPTGQQAWSEAFKAHEKEISFGGELSDILLAAGDAFFAQNSVESLHAAEAIRARLESYLERHRCEQRVRKRLVFPAGILFGAVLIILLI